MAGFIFGPNAKVHIMDIAFVNYDAAIEGNKSDISITNVHAYKTRTVIKGRDLTIKANNIIHDEHKIPHSLQPIKLSLLTKIIRRVNNGAF